MDKIVKVIRRCKNYRSTNSNVSTGTKKISLVQLVWRSLRNAGLVMSHNNDGIHWLANVSTIIFLVTTILQVVALIIAKDNPKRLFECFSILSFCSMGLVKLLSLRRYNNLWRSLLNEVTELESEELYSEKNPSQIEYESDDENSFTVSDYIQRYEKLFHSTFRVLIRIYGFTALVFILSPFTEYIFWKSKYQELRGLPHILPVWAPFDERSIYGYLLTISLEGVASVYCVFVHVAFDLSAVGLMIFIRGQFSLLHALIERIGGKGKKCNISRARDDRAHMRIKKCHCVHISLINIVKQLNHLTKNILGIYFCVATITLCTVAVQLKLELSTPQLVSLLQYMGATLTQLFLFCYYGDAVLNKSAIGMGEGPFGSAWWCLSPRIRRELLLLSIGASQRYQLYAGPLFSLNLPSFIQVVRTAYSYYAVIRQKSD